MQMPQEIGGIIISDETKTTVKHQERARLQGRGRPEENVFGVRFVVVY